MGNETFYGDGMILFTHLSSKIIENELPSAHCYAGDTQLYMSLF